MSYVFSSMVFATKFFFFCVFVVVVFFFFGFEYIILKKVITFQLSYKVKCIFVSDANKKSSS